MSNEKTGAACRIRLICKSKKVDQSDIYKKAKKLLQIYRDICWDTAEYAEQMQMSLPYEYDYCSWDLNSALMYLENFAPNEKRERFAETIQSLFRVKWMVEIVDAAMVRVRDFPLDGELYSEILSLFYLSRFQYSETEMLNQLEMERSTYYRRKKEAVTVFGLALWGGSIDKYRKVMNGPEEPKMSMFDQSSANEEKALCI